MEYFTEGKRGILFLDKFQGKKVVIKKEKRGLGRIRNEAKWLRRLNKYKLGPKLIKARENYIVYEFIKGDFFVDVYRKLGKKKSKNIVKEILRQCRVLDKLKVNKFEMHNPKKHILVGKKIVMIDFERCTKSERPKNVTQFCQYLVKINFIKRSKKLKELLRQYKGKQSEKNFRVLRKFVFS